MWRVARMSATIFRLPKVARPPPARRRHSDRPHHSRAISVASAVVALVGKPSVGRDGRAERRGMFEAQEYSLALRPRSDPQMFLHEEFQFAPKKIRGDAA
jgi:hypothetical protein